jgi:hypothetical protein
MSPKSKVQGLKSLGLRFLTLDIGLWTLGWRLSVLLLALASAAGAQDELPGAKPVPRMQVLPLPRSEASVERDGQEIAHYYFDSGLRRPFLYPIIGPSGKSLTRMGHPRDPNGHQHHNSVWVSHHVIGGLHDKDPAATGFWNDVTKGNIVHTKVEQYEDADDQAVIQVRNAWRDGTGKTLLDELRTMRFIPQDDGQWLLVLDLEFSVKEPTTIGKSNFGFVGVRMAKTIGVHDGGGTIRNSAGGVDEKGVHEKPARWCDYSGPIAREAHEGITLLDHPSNSNHPAVFHVRDDGWMGAAFTFAEPYSIEPGRPLKLRYGLWVHAGVPTAAQIDAQFAAFGKIGDPPAVAKR